MQLTEGTWVITCNFPIEDPIELPGINPILSESCNIKLSLWNGLGTNIYPDNAHGVHFKVDFKQGIFVLLKIRQPIKLGRFHKLAFEVIRPPMISTCQQRRTTRLSARDHGVGTMSAYIVEGAENGVLSEDKENGVARGMVKQLVRTRLRELACVCQRYGCLRSGQRDQYHTW
jgi:hypothetical protein